MAYPKLHLMDKLNFVRFVFLLLAASISSCTEKEAGPIMTDAMTATGDFLVEGPNTLQGNFSLDIQSLSDELGIDDGQVSKVHIDAITLVFEDPETTDAVESVLVQLVSNNLPLQSAGTLSAFSGKENLLNVNKDLDILAYINDSSSQLIVDANLRNDLDELSVSVVFQLTVKY